MYIVFVIYDELVGEVWFVYKIEVLKVMIECVGLQFDVVELVLVYEDIKFGKLGCDCLIDYYWQIICYFGVVGICVVCYNFMFVFDWMCIELLKMFDDGLICFVFSIDVVDWIDLNDGIVLFGWDFSYWFEQLQVLFVDYCDVDENVLWVNFEYFLKVIILVVEEVGVKMVIYFDDLLCLIFGLLCIVKNCDDFVWIVCFVDLFVNGLMLCLGLFGVGFENDVEVFVCEFGVMGCIYFVYICNVKVDVNGDFEEIVYLLSCGLFDIVVIVKVYYDIGFIGYVCFDYGCMIWGEMGKFGYGFYDCVFGVVYLNGLWEVLVKFDCVL